MDLGKAAVMRLVPDLAISGPRYAGRDEKGMWNTAGVGARRERRALCALAATFGALLIVWSVSPGSASAKTPAHASRQDIDRAVEEASVRFGLPSVWIRAVMRVESGGRRDAVSPKGAMGLMQLMPSTWREVSAEFGLGDDPFEPRANILAGAAYLRRMHDRYGAPGFLAAYNAGPARYESFLTGRQPLPAETLAYLGKLGPVVSGPVQSSVTAINADWQASAMFVTPGRDLSRQEPVR